MDTTIIQRQQFRAFVQNDLNRDDYHQALRECSERIKDHIQNKTVLAAGLYYYGTQLFFYVELLDESLRVNDLLRPLVPFLRVIPHQEGDRYFVEMVPVFYQAIPESLEDWQRQQENFVQRGRIAYLKEDKVMDYVYHHLELIREGHLCGDKYQFISIHENVLFSYFEEPKTITNIKRQPDLQSQAIEKWLELQPGLHFKPVIEGVDSHFTFIDHHFAYATTLK
jgi:hypothetical protein